MAHDVFISYSHIDKSAADAACATLESAGIRCWIAPRDISPGAEWAEAIIEAIGHSAVMVLIFSSSADQSQQVCREVERAINSGVTIMPVRIEPTEPTRSMAYFVAGLHWIDAITPPLEQHLQQLAISIAALLQAATTETTGTRENLIILPRDYIAETTARKVRTRVGILLCIVIPLAIILSITLVSRALIPITSVLLFGHNGLALSLALPPLAQTALTVALATAVGGTITQFPGTLTAKFLRFSVLDKNISGRFSQLDLAALSLYLDNIVKEQSEWVRCRIKNSNVLFSINFFTCWFVIGVVTLGSLYFQGYFGKR